MVKLFLKEKEEYYLILVHYILYMSLYITYYVYYIVYSLQGSFTLIVLCEFSLPEI